MSERIEVKQDSLNGLGLGRLFLAVRRGLRSRIGQGGTAGITRLIFCPELKWSQ